MKKTVLFILTVLTLNVSIGQARFGLKGGLNLANIKFEGVDNKARLGFNAGGLLQVDLTNKLSLRPELLYSVKGYRFPANQFYGAGTVSVTYINVPLLVSYRATQNLSLLMGPELGFLTGAKSRVDGEVIDVSRIYNEFDFGADLGLAYSLTKSLGIDLRYNYGFKGLYDVSYVDPNGYVTVKTKAGANRVLQLGLYYLISK